MRYTLALASLAAIAVAAPTKPTIDFTPHAKVMPHSVAFEETAEESYIGGYPFVVRVMYAENIADTNNMRRGPMKMADDIRYAKYPSYDPYARYGPYPSAVDEAAANMDMAKRHEMRVGTTSSVKAKDATVGKDDFRGED
jgi:hypothetical protein